MTPESFEHLSAADRQQLLDATPLIAILIAGADERIDQRELDWAEKLTNIRSFDDKNRLNDYYSVVEQNISERLRQLIDELPGDRDRREQELFERLGQLNDVLARMDRYYAKMYYENFRSYAKHVADSAGGFLGMMTVGPRESRLAELPMLNPVK